VTKGFFSTSKIRTVQKTGNVSHCGRCGLYKHCKSPKMPPTGKGLKKILVVAEAPGENEDEENIQLIGRAGQLLRRFLKSLDVNLDRDCWKTNAVICRREQNKTPEDYMIDACRPNLMKAIRKYKPNVIVLLGSVACKSLLKEIWKDDVGRVGRWGGFCIPCRELNAWIVPTYHPSYIMRQGDEFLNRIFKNHLKLAIDKAKNKPWDEVPDYRKQIEVITKPSKAARLLREWVNKGGTVAPDYETNCLKPEGEGTEIVSCAVCWRGRRTISYPWQGEAIDATSELLKSPMPKIASNLNFEDRWTRVKLGHRVKCWYWDTMIAAHVLNNQKGITSLAFQAFVWLGQESYDVHIRPFLKAKKGSRFNRIHELDLRDLLEYGGLDSRSEYWVAMRQMKLMERRKWK